MERILYRPLGGATAQLLASRNAPAMMPRLLRATALFSTQTRLYANPIETTKLSPLEGHEILVKQRLNRPVSPHLGIYKMEQTWFGASAWTRITGIALSGTAYAYFASYLVAPLLGLHLESASLAAAFAGLPLAAKAAFKFALGFPFAYHSFNGVRHLVFDLGKGFAKPTFHKSDLFVWASSVIAALYLAFGI